VFKLQLSSSAWKVREIIMLMEWPAACRAWLASAELPWGWNRRGGKRRVVTFSAVPAPWKGSRAIQARVRLRRPPMDASFPDTAV
jgi:hypothetical protein